MTTKLTRRHVTILKHILAVWFLVFSEVYVSAATVGWFYALEEDRAGFEKVMGPPIRTVNLSGGTIVHEYRAGAHKLLAARMGSGCVATAVTVARVLAFNSLERVISTGPAGGIGAKVKIGEWYGVGEVVGWQQGRAGEGGRIFLKEGATKPVPGWKFPQSVAGKDQDAQAAGSVDALLVSRDVRLVSGEVFVASGEKRAELAKDFEAELVEMNALGLMAAVEGTKAQVLILRVVSDFANERAGEDYADFLQTYDAAGGRMVAELVKGLPVGMDEPVAHEALKELLAE
jgi:adenosylhomocysteine nucleosidase